MFRCRLAGYAIALCTILLSEGQSLADGVSAVKSCEADTDPPEEIARLTLLPNGEPRGSDTASAIIAMARQKAKEGKDDEAMRWAALCNFADPSEQDAIKKDRAYVLEYLKQ